MNLDIIKGNLQSFTKFKEGTFRHIDEVVKEDINLKESNQIYTADGHGYFIENGRLKWAVTRGIYNPILYTLMGKNPERTLKMLNNFHAYWLNPEYTKTIISADSTEVFDVQELNLKKHDKYPNSNNPFAKAWDEPEGTRCIFNIIDSMIESHNPNQEQQKVMQRLGLTKEFFHLLRVEYDIHCVNVVVPDFQKDYIRKFETDPGSLWFTSQCKMAQGQLFILANVYSNLDRISLIGELPKYIDEKPKEEVGLSQYYRKILANPSEAVKSMDDATAQGLLRIIADYKRLKDK